jgi:hypothetical protein
MSTSVFFYEPFHAFDRSLDHGFSLRDDGAVRSLRYHPHHISSRCSQQDGPLQTNTVTATGLEKDDVSIETQDGRLMVSAESRPRADSEDLEAMRLDRGGLERLRGRCNCHKA